VLVQLGAAHAAEIVRAVRAAAAAPEGDAGQERCRFVCRFRPLVSF
jgi:hypothetical protein